MADEDTGENRWPWQAKFTATTRRASKADNTYQNMP